jgi:hypothetical protein
LAVRKTWVKLWTSTLGSSTAIEFTAEECWVWTCFLMLAGISPVEGYVCIRPGLGYSDDELARLIRNVTPEVVRSTKQKAVEFDKVKLHGPTGRDFISILNWERYQGRAEYMREYMKKYRGRKKEADRKK